MIVVSPTENKNRMKKSKVSIDMRGFPVDENDALGGSRTTRNGVGRE